MTDPSSAADMPLLAARLLARWDRAGLAVRCGHDPSDPRRLHDYLAAGQRVARYGVRPPAAVRRRMLDVLLQAARDQVLPVAWRSACVGQAERLLAQGPGRPDSHEPASDLALRRALRAAAELVARSGG